jgi:hypothetical protein
VLVSYVCGLTCLAAQEDLNRVKALWPALLLLAPVGFGLHQAIRVVSHPGLFVLIPLFLAWTLWSASFLSAGRRNVPRAVTGLIAGISLLDGVLMAAVSPGVAGPVCALLGFVATRALQRHVPGT